MIALESPKELTEALKRSVARQPSAEALQQQRVSFVYGSLPESNDMTRDQVARKIEEHDRMTGK